MIDADIDSLSENLVNNALTLIVAANPGSSLIPCYDFAIQLGN